MHICFRFLSQLTAVRCFSPSGHVAAICSLPINSLRSNRKCRAAPGCARCVNKTLVRIVDPVAVVSVRKSAICDRAPLLIGGFLQPLFPAGLYSQLSCSWGRWRPERLNLPRERAPSPDCKPSKIAADRTPFPMC